MFDFFAVYTKMPQDKLLKIIDVIIDFCFDGN